MWAKTIDSPTHPIHHQDTKDTKLIFRQRNDALATMGGLRPRNLFSEHNTNESLGGFLAALAFLAVQMGGRV
jgi:hypothetical protein